MNNLYLMSDIKFTGIAHMRLLVYTWKEIILARFPSDEGMLPLRLLLPKLRKLSEVIFPSLGGIPPVKLLTERSTS